MKVIATLTLLLASSQAFTAVQPSTRAPVVALAMAKGGAATAAMDRSVVRKSIARLTADTFESTLKDIEPFLTKEAGLAFYSKCIRRIGHKANELGVTMPTDYALEAKATEKRREKQNAFIQQKIEEAAEAAAAAAAAAEEAEEAAVEEAEPVAA